MNNNTYQLFGKNHKEIPVQTGTKVLQDDDEDQKSPMVAMRELAKCNQLQPVFDITKEDGPPHDKTFDVTLSLGAQTWQGTGKSIKKAQMDAASKALKEYNFPKLMKNSKKIKIANPSSLTPTVLLNGLAMARGEAVQYRVISKVPLPSQPIYTDPSKYYYDFGNMYADAQQPFHVPFQYDIQRRYNKPVQRWIHPQLFRVEVLVGDRSFIGEGKSQQAARHAAAQKALDVLQEIPVPTKTKKPGKEGTEGGENPNPDDEKSDKAHKIVKSPISELYEKASAHKLRVDFTVTSENGLPHLKLFTIKVDVQKHARGTDHETILSAEGQGPNKNVAKTKAAAAALIKFKEASLPTCPPSERKKPRSKKNESKSSATDVSNVLHPVSRLTQIMQAKKTKEPTYTILQTKDVNQRNTGFIIQVTAMEKTTTGEGRSKKDAKRAAAENLLKELGFYTKTDPETALAMKAPGKSILKPPTGVAPVLAANLNNNADTRVKFRNAPKPNILPPLLET